MNYSLNNCLLHLYSTSCTCLFFFLQTFILGSTTVDICSYFCTIRRRLSDCQLFSRSRCKAHLTCSSAGMFFRQFEGFLSKLRVQEGSRFFRCTLPLRFHRSYHPKNGNFSGRIIEKKYLFRNAELKLRSVSNMPLRVEFEELVSSLSVTTKRADHAAKCSNKTGLSLLNATYCVKSFSGGL